ncbi:MAG TPA: amidohydrolase family protein [Reyranella sp.]|nr:amidohydrolase family protein [Reyranella sp.]
MAARKLLKSGIVVTQDRALGVLPRGDVLVEGERIAAIDADLRADGAEVIDCAGHFVMPGLVNAHMHTWQTALRSIAANWTLLEYFRHVHAGLATVFTPDDIHIATLAGALNQLDHGVTTLVDWAHNNPTPAHSDAGIAALKESGIRAAFFHGSPKPDAKPGERHFSEIPHPRAEVERLMKSDLGPLVTLGMAVLGPHYSTLEVSAHDFALARELGLVASMHQGGGEAKTPGGWEALMQRGLVGPHINVVHGNNLTDDQLKAFVELGVSFSVTPENEMAQGHGHPITGRLRALGSPPSLGVDLESAIGGDMFTVARMALASQRALDNAAERGRNGGIPATSTVPAAEALEWITTRGASMLGMNGSIGSLSAGKQADITVMSLGELAMWPVHDPVATVVMQGSGARVRDVLVAGEFRKKDGRLLFAGLDGVRRRLANSGERILGRLNVPSISRHIGAA